MPYLTISELNTHLYGEVVNEITRENDQIAQDAIDAAIAEAIGYLSAYDTAAILASAPGNRNAILLLYIKDIAVWHFLNLSNPSVELELRLRRYEKAIEWLKAVQSGKSSVNLPLPGSPVSDNNYIKYGSNRKRNNYF